MASIAISFFAFRPFLLTRATFSDQSTIARKFYDVTGVKMAINNPLFGLSPGADSGRVIEFFGRVQF